MFDSSVNASHLLDAISSGERYRENSVLLILRWGDEASENTLLFAVQGCRLSLYVAESTEAYTVYPGLRHCFHVDYALDTQGEVLGKLYEVARLPLTAEGILVGPGGCGTTHARYADVRVEGMHVTGDMTSSEGLALLRVEFSAESVDVRTVLPTAEEVESNARICKAFEEMRKRRKTSETGVK